jgi:4'-phosphopantetheinyl transferase EntD
VIEELLPAGVVAVETCEERLDIALSPSEEAACGQMTDRRRREFRTARWCAQLALGRLGLPPAPIPVGPHGEPCWPRGVLGSITHCAGYRACALARTRDVATVGIDAERHAALPRGVLDAITTAGERTWLSELMDARPDVHWDRLAFSVKEAVYKAQFAIAKRHIELADVLVAFDPLEQVFRARLPAPGVVVDDCRRTALHGRWLSRDGLVLTAIALPRLASTSPPLASASPPPDASRPGGSRTQRASSAGCADRRSGRRSSSAG